MTFQITIENSDIHFDIAENETILSAIQRAGYDAPYSCNKGICGNCKGSILSGNCQSMSASDGISKEELAQGQALFCVAKANSNLVIQAARITKKDEMVCKEFKLKIFKLISAADDVTIVQLRMPIGQRAKFKAGQFLEVMMPNGQKRSYSLANAPSADTIELHIRHVPQGKFSSEYLPSLKVGDILNIEFPKGDFYLRPGNSPIILLASGTGFAPIQSILTVLEKNDQIGLATLYWVARSKKDLYALDKIKKIQESHPEFRFIPVLSEPTESDNWQGRQGFVHQAVLDDFESLENHMVYACGAPIMVQSAKKDFSSLKKLSPEQFFSDAFV